MRTSPNATAVDAAVLEFIDPDGSGPRPAALAERLLVGPDLAGLLDQVYADENVSTGAVTWLLADNLDSTRDAIDANGNVLGHYVFNSFGQLVSGPTSVTQFLFTGRWTDTNTGLQYNGNRWYDPSVGRWISEDPADLTYDTNASRYVGNQPTTFIDPTGLSGESGSAPLVWPGSGDDLGQAGAGSTAAGAPQNPVVLGSPQAGRRAGSQPNSPQSPSGLQPPNGGPRYGTPPTAPQAYGRPPNGAPPNGAPGYGGAPGNGAPPNGPPGYGAPPYGSQPGAQPPNGTRPQGPPPNGPQLYPPQRPISQPVRPIEFPDAVQRPGQSGEPPAIDLPVFQQRPYPSGGRPFPRIVRPFTGKPPQGNHINFQTWQGTEPKPSVWFGGTWTIYGPLQRPPRGQGGCTRWRPFR